ncbi:MAG: DUF1573 domain-containing protein [Thermoguttaceae bacterium]
MPAKAIMEYSMFLRACTKRRVPANNYRQTSLNRSITCLVVREKRQHFKFSSVKLLTAYSVAGIALAIFFSLTSLSHAQSWADNMFEIKSHNFGSVPLLSDTRYSFVFHNKEKEDVHILSATSSCSCTEPIITKRTIKSGEKGEIIAKINTSGQHVKNKGATITVKFDRPREAIVQLEVSVYIRPDIVLSSGAVDFGAVQEGKEVSRKLTLQYAGDPKWELVKIQRANDNKYIHARAERKELAENGRDIIYEITVTLSPKTPPGYVREILRFVTNEKRSNAKGQGEFAAIELPITGIVMDPLVAKPSPFQFGSVSPGETVTKYMVLRAAQPFKVKSVTSDDNRLYFSPSDQVSSIHIIAVTITSEQNSAEKVSRLIKVNTDLNDQGTITVPVYVRFLSVEETDSKEFYAAEWKSKITGSSDPLTKKTQQFRKLRSGETASSKSIESENQTDEITISGKDKDKDNDNQLPALDLSGIELSDAKNVELAAAEKGVEKDNRPVSNATSTDTLAAETVVDAIKSNDINSDSSTREESAQKQEIVLRDDHSAVISSNSAVVPTVETELNADKLVESTQSNRTNKNSHDIEIGWENANPEPIESVIETRGIIELDYFEDKLQADPAEQIAADTPNTGNTSNGVKFGKPKNAGAAKNEQLKLEPAINEAVTITLDSEENLLADDSDTKSNSETNNNLVSKSNDALSNTVSKEDNTDSKVEIAESDLPILTPGLSEEPEKVETKKEPLKARVAKLASKSDNSSKEMPKPEALVKDEKPNTNKLRTLKSQGKSLPVVQSVTPEPKR